MAVDKTEVLTFSERMKLQYAITEIIAKSFAKLKRDVRSDYNKFSRDAAKTMENLIEEVVNKYCHRILSAAKTKPDAEKLISECRKRREEARAILAEELKSGRKKLKTLQWKINNAEAEASRLTKEKEYQLRKDVANRLKSGRSRLKKLKESYSSLSDACVRAVAYKHEYPDIPLPQFDPNQQGAGIPAAPGIYFLWEGDQIVYVGQARVLCNRLRLGSHHILNEKHRISFIFVKPEELTWTECYYIGLAKPRLNFGRKAAHYQGDDE
jgi:hypothetical protein